MYLSLIVLPLLGCIVTGFFGRKVGVSGAQLITCACVVITTMLSILGFFEVGLNNVPVTINLFRWIDSEWFNIIWGFQYDSLTASMLIPVLMISSLVHIYSISYMSNDPHNQRFFSYLSLFTFMMIILVTANNYLLMFVGWEGVGVCSYLLVSFWFTRIAANQSSISAFLANRVGDCFLTIGMFAILWSLGNLDYATVFSLAPYINSNVVIIIGICLLIGAMAKSSQVGLHIWLPMAMEGPTPVSALIHAATMVTAGVYLLMRSSPLIEYSNIVLLLCLWLGGITTVFSSVIGLFQQDIKKIVAYSTMSQQLKARKYIVGFFNIFWNQTICVKARCTKHTIANSQITKARDYLCQLWLYSHSSHNHFNFKFFDSSAIRLYLYIMSRLIRWKFEIISKLVGISEIIRLILIFFGAQLLKLINLMFNLFIDAHALPASDASHAPYVSAKNRLNKPLPKSPLLNNRYCCFNRKMSTNISSDSLDSCASRTSSTSHASLTEDAEDPDSNPIAFKEWLAGLIDGDGSFSSPKNGKPRFEITMDAKDKKVLYLIKDQYHGSIKEISNGYAFKYRLKNNKNLILLIQDINGLIRNPIRLLQMSKLCKLYGIELKYYDNKFLFNDGWFSGFLDSDGSICYDNESKGVHIGITQKNKYLLDPLTHIYGGIVKVCRNQREGFEYVIYRKKDLFKLIDNYFDKYPLRTAKMAKINLIKDFYFFKLNENNLGLAERECEQAKWIGKWKN